MRNCEFKVEQAPILVGGVPKIFFVFDICWLLMLVFTDLKKREELRVQGRAFGPQQEQ